MTVDHDAAETARRRQVELLKPPGSLGRLEDLAVWMAAVTGDPIPDVRPEIVIAAADHGVTAERISAYPAEVTAQMLTAFLAGGSAISAIAGHHRAPITVVDAGVAAAPRDDRVIRTGLAPSANLAQEPALSREAVETALACGRQLAGDAQARGSNLIIGGDMGIGNTTPATCLAAWLTDKAPAGLCGRGTGVDDEGLRRKQHVVTQAIARHGETGDPAEALRRMGGGEIAVLCGLALGTAERGMGFLCDGLIATAAAAIAAAISPGLRPRLLAGHRSPEPAHTALLEHLDLDPLLDLEMRLGEASGAATALGLVQLACVLHRDMATFAEAGVTTAPA